MTNQRLALSALAALALIAFVAPGARADVVTDWNEVTLDTIRAERIPPPRASRLLALVHTAVYDAVNGILAGVTQPYHVTDAAPPGASAEAAAAAAAHHVLATLFPARQAEYSTALGTSLASVPDGQAEDDGVVWGDEVATQILALRSADHSGDIVAHPYPVGASWWIPTPPAFLPTLLPNWPLVTPWAMKSGDQFRVPAPPPPNSEEYLAAFLEVKRFGRVDSTFRDAEQTQIALFWNDGGGTNTPPGHWHTIGQGLVAQEGLNLQASARLFALLAITNADAAIASWDNKYHYDHWRPVTGIQHADTDGNPDTSPDAAWSSLITTPPFPAYTSGHSTFSGSSARLLEHFFGTDDISFSTVSDGLPGVTRSFTSFSQAAEEAGQSRIYGGIHWQYDNKHGLASGQDLADLVFFNVLRPVEEGGFACLPNASRLCLSDGRFEVKATWRTTSDSGQAQAVTLGDDSGSFSFFDPSNTELTVKVLNACDGFERFWVFASGLTNVEVTLSVVDSHTGKTRIYFNPQGRAFEPIQDTDAFATCN